MQRVLMTRAGRGIGLKLTRHDAARGDRVLSSCRDIYLCFPASDDVSGDRLVATACADWLRERDHR